MLLTPIAFMHSSFPTKFGIPRQSGLVQELRSTIVFEPEFRVPEALRGLDQFSHLWIIWGFSQMVHDGWSPTVRPPRLGGNTRMGVFATRSPNRPNPLGLSSVQIDKLEQTKRFGWVIHVLGADLMDQTPIYDIKPYLSFTDSHPDAHNGFSEAARMHALPVCWDCDCPLDNSQKSALTQILSQDPRPAYQDDPSRVYGFPFAGHEIHYRVDTDGILHILGVLPVDI